MLHLITLPIESLYGVVLAVPTMELAGVALVNHLMAEICNDDHFWRCKIRQEFPDAVLAANPRHQYLELRAAKRQCAVDKLVSRLRVMYSKKGQPSEEAGWNYFGRTTLPFEVSYDKNTDQYRVQADLAIGVSRPSDRSRVVVQRSPGDPDFTTLYQRGCYTKMSPHGIDYQRLTDERGFFDPTTVLTPEEFRYYHSLDLVRLYPTSL